MFGDARWVPESSIVECLAEGALADESNHALPLAARLLHRAAVTVVGVDMGAAASLDIGAGMGVESWTTLKVLRSRASL